MQSIEDYYAGKRVLITGATGMIGRILVEKFLRDLPQIDRLYVLIRPRHRGESVISPQDRLTQDLLGSSAFDRLRQELGDEFSPYVNSKVEVVSGDLTQPRLGLDDETYDELQEKIDLIINSAAVVSFDAPIDEALQLNTLGPLRIVEFAKGCRGATVAHLSTCYVNVTREGPIAEEPLDPFVLAATKNGSPLSSFDIDEEVADLERLTQMVHQQSSSLLHRAAFAIKVWFHRAHPRLSTDGSPEPEAERYQRSWVEHRMVAEGMRWAQRRGVNDVYTLTKAMGEQLLMRHRGDVPTLILRPSTVESAIESPTPGWLDGMRMVDPLIVAYGRGILPDFPGRNDSIFDIVPVDMVVNALLAVIPKTSFESGPVVYHSASGMRNPLTARRFADLVQEHYQSENGLHAGSFPRITFPTTRAFLRKLRFKYLIPLALVAPFIELAPIIPKGRRLRSRFRAKRGGIQRLAYYARIYGPYGETRVRYLSECTDKVWESLTEEERSKFNFNVADIDWQDYIQNVHIPGLKRFVLGTALKAPQGTAISDRTKGVSKDGSVSGPANRQSQVHAPGSNGSSPIESGAIPSGGASSARFSEKWARYTIPMPDDEELDRWVRDARSWVPVRFLLRWSADRLLQYYTGLKYEGMENIPKSGPFIVAANHTSHIDTGILLVLLAQGRDIHPLAAKDYFFRNRVKAWAARRLVDAAPFDRHSYSPDSLALPFGLLARNHTLLYFPEGGRSSDGKIHSFKPGIGLLALEAGVLVVPTYIQGSYQVLPKGHSIPKKHPVTVHFGPALSAKSYLETHQEEGPQELSRRFAEDVEQAVRALS